jgi:hypothetical protein
MATMTMTHPLLPQLFSLSPCPHLFPTLCLCGSAMTIRPPLLQHLLSLPHSSPSSIVFQWFNSLRNNYVPIPPPIRPSTPIGTQGAGPWCPMMTLPPSTSLLFLLPPLFAKEDDGMGGTETSPVVAIGPHCWLQLCHRLDCIGHNDAVDDVVRHMAIHTADKLPHTRIPPTAVACGTMLLLHHNALAVVREGNEGGGGGGRGSFLFFLFEMMSGIGEAQGEGRGGSNESYIAKACRKLGGNVPLIVDICTHTFSKARATLGKICIVHNIFLE